MEFNEIATIEVELDAGQDKYPFERIPQVRYESSNPDVVAVDAETGTLTAGTMNGTATITAYADEALRDQEGLDEIVTASVNITVEGGEQSQTPVTEVFTDIKAGQWYVDAVQYVYDNGMMSGSKGLFNPTKNITREQVAATLYNMEGNPKPESFQAVTALKDVKAGQWYTDAICWAYGTGLISGSKTSVNGTTVYNLNPTGNATRAQMASILQKFCETYDI